MAGCEQRCPGCYVPETHDLKGGSKLGVYEVAGMLLAAEGEPRDGITILGGEPLLQPEGLLALMRLLKERAQHITLYTGFTLEELLHRNDPIIHQLLALTDILIDGPFIRELSHHAGEWRGSTNQRVIHQPAHYLSTQNSAV